MFTLSSAGKSRGGGYTKWGHFWGGQWRIKGETPDAEAAPAHEVWLSAQHLADGALSVLGTIVHEAAHAMNHSLEIKDTDKTGRVHNKKFKKAAEALSLIVADRDKNRGFAFTNLPEEAANATYAAGLAALTTALVGYRAPEQKGKSKQRLLKAVCGCGTIIRASNAVIEQATVSCLTCGEVFAAEE